jgi:hypothetical protein
MVRVMGMAERVGCGILRHCRQEGRGGGFRTGTENLLQSEAPVMLRCRMETGGQTQTRTLDGNAGMQSRG